MPLLINQAAKRTSLPLLALFCLLPAIQTAVSVHLQWHTNFTYPAFKLLMVALPITVWWLSGLSLTEVYRVCGCRRTRMLAGLALGLLMAGAIVGAYYGLLRSRIDPTGILSKVRSLELLDYYWVMALFISLAHSLFEEYYWRGFVLSQLGGRISGIWPLSVTAGVVFGIHHTFALLSLFDWPIVALCVLGTMAAGLVWSRMRLLGYSIWDCYISHVFADLAVMWIGYDLILRAN